MLISSYIIYLSYKSHREYCLKNGCWWGEGARSSLLPTALKRYFNFVTPYVCYELTEAEAPYHC